MPCSIINHLQADDEAGKLADPKSDSNEPQEILESDLSGSEYQKSELVTESESDEDEDKPKLEVDEPDTVIAQKKKKGKEKKVKPGVLFREGVHLMHDVNDGGSQKCKAPSESHRCVILAWSKSITDMSLRIDHQLPRRQSKQL